MSAISGFLSTIRNAVYGYQVREAIASGIEQCYDDVNSPSLQSDAFATALNEAYADGILDIQTVTTIAGMTNQNIIYRYNGTETGKNKGLYYYNGTAWVLIGSEIQQVSAAAQMTDQKAIYKYTGSETGMVSNTLYFYNGTNFTPIASGSGSDESVADLAEICYGLFSKAVFTENVVSLMSQLQAVFTPDIVSISAVFTQGDLTVTEATSLDTLKTNLVVTALDEDNNTTTVSADDYMLTGTLSVGTSTVIVNYAGKTTTFTVTVVSGNEEYTIVDTISYRQNATYKTTEYMPAVLCLNYDSSDNTTEFSGKVITEMQFPTTHANATVSIGKCAVALSERPSTTGLTSYTLDADAKVRFSTPITIGANETILIGNSGTDTLGLPFATSNKELNPMWVNSEAVTRSSTLLFCAKVKGYIPA